MTTRDRIAKRLREIVVPPIGFEDANWLADAVLDELGWDDAPTLVSDRPGPPLTPAEWDDLKALVGVAYPVGSYRLIREGVQE